ncbi:methyltransferase-domain-containing protein [Schizothecium vesticola]|uniref:Ribosomal RNA-processing protein 8 n=1 Tax=Schizothecium vesticola TaxID=314040 RepID=A0AA40F4E2_9PEZI|nr:methyltransferase-domain-containing protein [Schizothecium vesticola]
MFAVKGWSVSADKLKVEINNGTPNGAPAPDSSAPPKNKKRKRPGNAQSVTADNLGDLWEKVIDKKPPVSLKDPEKARARREKKKARRAEQQAQVSETAIVEKTTEDGPAAEVKDQEQEKPKGDKAEKPKAKEEEKPKEKKDKKSKAKDTSAAVAETVEEPTAADDEEWGGLSDDEPAPAATKTKQHEQPENDRKKKRQKLDKKPQSEQKATAAKDTGSKPTDTKPTQPAPPAPPAVKLTPLQASMREKLVSARFRHLNETLYTRPSAEAFRLFDDTPEMFSEYHEGFRRQVDVWPENPVDGFIADIEARAKVRSAPKNARHDFANPLSSIRLLPLPRNMRAPGSACTIADLGCGDAALAARLQPSARKLRVDIKSFDLQTGASPLITRADIAHLPLADGSVDVAVFCLALMGTNWLDFVEEAYRVLRWKGELWIAEIKSRFAHPAAAGNKKSKVVAHSVGNRRNPGAGAPPPPPGKKSKKARDNAEAAAEADDAALAVAVDGAELRRNETDVSAFVDALRARGFLLHKELGAGAVDLDNKMFVRMHFVKAAPAVKGKCVTAETARELKSGGQGGMNKQKRFAVDDEEDAANESAILKPCVYKLR